MGVNQVHMDFSHVDIFGSLIAASSVDPLLEQDLYAALQSKDQSSVASLTQSLDKPTREALLQLTELNGDQAILQKAAKVLPAMPAIKAALASLMAVSQALADLDVSLSFDLSELRGYHYHSGMVFAAYAQGYKGPLALGGRYDEVGSAFGRARPATGFSLDLRGLITALPPLKVIKGILAPYVNDASLLNIINSLRSSGDKVIQELPGHDAHIQELGCDRKLVHQAGQWQVVSA